MNIRSNPDTVRPAVTTGSLPSSRKFFAIPDELQVYCGMAVGYHGRKPQEGPYTYYPSLLEMAKENAESSFTAVMN